MWMSAMTNVYVVARSIGRDVREDRSARSAARQLRYLRSGSVAIVHVSDRHFEREVAEARKTETPKVKAPNTKEDKKKNAKKQELEKKISVLEAQLSELAEQLAHPPKDAGAVVKLAKDYDNVQKEMDTTMAEWEALQG